MIRNIVAHTISKIIVRLYDACLLFKEFIAPIAEEKVIARKLRMSVSEITFNTKWR